MVTTTFDALLDGDACIFIDEKDKLYKEHGVYYVFEKMQDGFVKDYLLKTCAPQDFWDGMSEAQFFLKQIEEI